MERSERPLGDVFGLDGAWLSVRVDIGEIAWLGGFPRACTSASSQDRPTVFVMLAQSEGPSIMSQRHDPSLTVTSSVD
ncbi:MAG: hypothetical protein ACO39Q_11460, partial [Ilumatobacteraceae bacterium]